MAPSMRRRRCSPPVSVKSVPREVGGVDVDRLDAGEHDAPLDRGALQESASGGKGGGQQQGGDGCGSQERHAAPVMTARRGQSSLKNVPST